MFRLFKIEDYFTGVHSRYFENVRAAVYPDISSSKCNDSVLSKIESPKLDFQFSFEIFFRFRLMCVNFLKFRRKSVSYKFRVLNVRQNTLFTNVEKLRKLNVTDFRRSFRKFTQWLRIKVPEQTGVQNFPIICKKLFENISNEPLL